MSPNTSIFFHIAALILGSQYEVVGITAEESTNESSASSEGGEGGARRRAQRFLKPVEKGARRKEKRQVWKVRVYAEKTAEPNLLLLLLVCSILSTLKRI